MWQHPSTRAYVPHPALEVINVFKSLNNVEDAGGGACSNESVGGPLAFGPALFFGSNVAASFGQSEVFQTSNPSVPLLELYSSSVLSTHAENVCPDSSVLQHPKGLVQCWIES